MRFLRFLRDRYWYGFSFQNPDGTVNIPDELRRFMPSDRERIERTKALPELKLVKSLKENWF